MRGGELRILREGGRMLAGREKIEIGRRWEDGGVDEGAEEK